MPSAAPQTTLNLRDLLFYVEQVLSRGIPGAVWVRAEIASLTDRRHLYLDLVQVGEDGREVAKCRATLWARERFALEAKFRRATGGVLMAGMSVLLFVTAEFHPQYGFSLHILDASPEFTLGDAALRLDELRKTLAREKLLDKNRSLPIPQDFTRLLVLSPTKAAGLGDFRGELDRLQGAGVLDVQYFEATFQGVAAEASLLGALTAALDAHAEEAADALVIIRGGGASLDLAWLNSEVLARAVAAFPMPVITGIGHARDDTILDELANVRTDTPSKAAAYIVGTVVERVEETLAAYQTIRLYSREVLGQAESGTERLNERIHRAARTTLDAASASLDATMRQVLGLTPERTLARGYALVRNAAGEVVTRAGQVSAGQALELSFVDGAVDVVAGG
ncbi:exodeoxyribonuclease VII large subunit [Deinococcus psychrotolerans]|uniref:Exodeoxyribonuclease 7 large subunit n=1 Tax=Deinococcus psychrotolerans TaxID=2489213 RepID=A0A3G8YC76_9DEIO|nr:exodeoxyribonuclease VII large subunit [Deinococcus psychrotolerans]AZI42908.1 exodeoxyribonuclease VII large subunit [Deinococcus psychrotolerans]